MGTNYYHESTAHLGEGPKIRHIGKSSGGWCFALRVYPDEGINDLSKWIDILGEGKIVDEYGDYIGVEKMLEIITKRSCDKKPDWTEFEYRQNHAEPGPNNLVRSKVDGVHCIGHGEGTWDLIIGDFF